MAKIIGPELKNIPWQDKPEGYKMLNGDDYTMLLKESHFNPRQNPSIGNVEELNYNVELPETFHNYNKNTDWVDLVSKHGYTNEHNIALTGGGEKATFRISGGYYNETGTIIRQLLDRFTTTMALDYYVSDRIKVVSDFSFTYTNNRKNYEYDADGDGANDGILAASQIIMPNMSIYRYDRNGNMTDDYFQMQQNADGIFDGNQKNIKN